jgi:ABC-type amino acid transport substrate-binding protein
MREIAAVGCSQERLRAEGGNAAVAQAATGQADAVGVMRAVVELLAREWPDEYPAGRWSG